jgi:hypothetical protein
VGRAPLDGMRYVTIVSGWTLCEGENQRAEGRNGGGADYRVGFDAGEGSDLIFKVRKLFDRTYVSQMMNFVVWSTKDMVSLQSIEVSL